MDQEKVLIKATRLVFNGKR